MLPVAVIVSPGRYRVPPPPETVFQPTKVDPVFKRFPVFPGMVGDENSLVVMVEGVAPEVGEVPLKEIFKFHIAYKVVVPVAV